MLPNWYWEYKNFIEEWITYNLDNHFDKKGNVSKALYDFEEVIRYSLKWWKKIRAILALEFYLLLSNKNINEIEVSDDIIKVCTSIELSHSWTLLQDDLPCMDNDTLRRWQPTVWAKFGEYQAVLWSDILQTLAYEIITELEDSKQALHIIKILTQAMWYYWVIWWQIEDLHYERNSKDLDKEILLAIHKKKTGILIKSSVEMWIVTANKSELINDFAVFWEKLWLAYQIKDDILDVEGSVQETGKSVWSWEEKGFVYFEWLEKSKQELQLLIEDCLSIAAELDSEKLTFITNYIWNRNK